MNSDHCTNMKAKLARFKSLWAEAVTDSDYTSATLAAHKKPKAKLATNTGVVNTKPEHSLK